jgi:hypothetical protein
MQWNIPSPFARLMTHDNEKRFSFGGAVHAQLGADGFEVRPSGPDGLRRRIEEEVPRWRAVITKAGISTI